MLVLLSLVLPFDVLCLFKGLATGIDEAHTDSALVALFALDFCGICFWLTMPGVADLSCRLFD